MLFTPVVFCVALLATSGASSDSVDTMSQEKNATSTQARHRHDTNSTDADKIRGVNLGGWLVLEPWITPTLFEKANEGVPRNTDNSFQVVDEWTWRSAPPGSQDRSALLVDHWNTWVTQSDISDLAAAGISHLRIPVGYWYFDIDPASEPFVSDAMNYPKALEMLKTVVNSWAKAAGLKVLIDLHTAPGSQNGFDNSGRRGTMNLLAGNNLVRWNNIVDSLAIWTTKNLDKGVFWGIEVLNEPAGWNPDIFSSVKNFINPRGYQAIRNYNPDLNVIFQTAFQPFSNQASYQEPTYSNCWFDDHNYQAFGDTWNFLALQPDGWATHLKDTCAGRSNYDISNTKLFTFGGEWSLGVTDCTIYLVGGMNGGCDMKQDPQCKYRGTLTQKGHFETCAYYTRTVDQLDVYYREFMGEFARAQMDAFEVGNGWFFWNFKTENNHAPAWDYLLGWREGWMPSNAANRDRYCV